MALNGGALNTHAVNASAIAGFVQSTGSTSTSIEQIVNALGSASSNIDQIVGKYGSSSASIEQIVALYETGSSSISIEQIVNSTASKSVEVEQFVRDLTVTDFYSRNSYEPIVYINNVKQSQSLIHSIIEVIFQEDQAPQAKITLIPARGTQDIASYRGKSLKVNVRTSTGVTRLYTGTINEPDVQIINQKIVLHSSLDIEQEIQSLSNGFIDSIGYYNNNVFSKPRTKKQELMDRISTIPKTVDWDRYGNIRITNIAAKSTQDYTLTSSQVRREDINYRFSSRQRYINKINIKANYNWQRLHHYQRGFSVTGGGWTFCQFATNAYTPLSRDLVSQAANGVGWAVSSLAFTDFYAGDYYTCNGATIGFITTKCDTTTKPVKDSSGGQVTNDGNNQYEVVPTACTNTTSTLCLSATWQGSIRFSQNITEQVTLSVTAPQSIADYGTKLKEETFTLSDSFDYTAWEDYSEYSSSAPDGYSITGSSGNNFWVDAKADTSTFNNSVTILLNRAKADILKSHRDDIVTIKRDLWPEIQLYHTVYLNTNRVVCKGKVKSYRHVMDVSTGEAYTMVDLAMSRSTGSTTDSDLSLPSFSLSTYNPVYETGTISFGATFGIDVSTVTNPSGFYGNKLTTVSNNSFVTQYPVALIVKTPPVQDSVRKSKTIPLSTSFNVSIPNDTLTIIFPDDNYV